VTTLAQSGTLGYQILLRWSFAWNLFEGEFEGFLESGKSNLRNYAESQL
jgi:hypothetical protein